MLVITRDKLGRTWERVAFILFPYEWPGQMRVLSRRSMMRVILFFMCAMFPPVKSVLPIPSANTVSPVMRFPSQHKQMEPFFFNDASTTEIYTLSLHDALPI